MPTDPFALPCVASPPYVDPHGQLPDRCRRNRFQSLTNPWEIDAPRREERILGSSLSLKDLCLPCLLLFKFVKIWLLREHLAWRYWSSYRPNLFRRVWTHLRRRGSPISPKNPLSSV